MSEDIHHLYGKYLSCKGVSTDTRNISPGCLFIALKGPNFDANTFAAEALEKGAAYAVVDDPSFVIGERYVLVEDGLQTLQDLATHHRDQLGIPVVGITGSNGKTTTKELIYAVLSKMYQVAATKGNLNNHIGVPLTLLEIDSHTELAIIEMGANHQGEIARLCEIAQPTHGLITNIGHAHVEGFGGFEGVIRGKSELYQYLIQNKGAVFINSHDPVLSSMAKRFVNPYFYPGPGDFLQAELIAADPYVKFISEQGPVISTQLIGEYNFTNIAAALCIGKFFEVPSDQAQQAISDYKPRNNRSQVIHSDNNTVILDAYNANPSSMSAALKNLLSMKAPQKSVILGDMLELGEVAQEAHFQIGIMTEAGFERVIFCGELMKNAHRANPESEYFVNKTDLIAALKEKPIRNSTVLIKASRSMGLEALVDFV